MGQIKIPVEVLDENCAGCQCMSLKKEDLYFDFDQKITQYSCENLHMCMYIRNRIVRSENKTTKKDEEEQAQ